MLDRNMIKKRLSFTRRGSNCVEAMSSRDEEVEWEMRPGGLLVQKRVTNSDSPVPNLLVRVSYGAARYEISISSQATFGHMCHFTGELKKLLTAETGLQPGEQKLLFRNKERQNGEYLDRCGVNARSKVILMDDPESRERRMIEMRRNAKILVARGKIDGLSKEIDRLAEQVFVIEKSVANGSKVAEVQITTLIEMLMRQAVKLDSISVEGGPCAAQKDLQGKRVQKCVETLDILKVSNQRIEVEKPVVMTTKWETFGSPLAQTSTTNWEYFD